jgi:uncharacterized protein YdaU (DUF1376 family)
LKKREIMHYYQFHIGDYASHTRHLSLIEDIAYRRLLDFYYLHEQPIKQRDIARQIGMRDHEQDVLTVLNEFFVSTDDGFVSPRADKEIQHYHSKVEQASKAGKASAERRSNIRSADVQPTNNQEPITNNHKPKRESATVVACPPDVSEQVWQDWLALRKAKKAAVTSTVLDGARKEADKLGWPLEKFLVEWCTRGSQGLKAEWVAPKPTFAQQAADVARSTVPAQHTGPDPVLLKIEADRQKAVPMPDHIRQQINQVLRKV